MSDKVPYVLMYEFEVPDGDRDQFEATIRRLAEVTEALTLPVVPFMGTAFSGDQADDISSIAHGRDCAVRVTHDGQRVTGEAP